MDPHPDPFARRMQLPIYWHNKAADLRASAGAVWVAMLDKQPDSRLGIEGSMAVACPQVFRMLCGLALELCFKAIILAKGDKPPFSHDLVSLGQLADVAFDQRATGLLRVLSDAILWMGRYPLPTGSESAARTKWDDAGKAIDKSLFDEVGLGRFKVLTPNHSLDWVGFSQLWETTTVVYWQHHRDEPLPGTGAGTST
jgi:hypothetical protein